MLSFPFLITLILLSNGSVKQQEEKNLSIQLFSFLLDRNHSASFNSNDHFTHFSCTDHSLDNISQGINPQQTEKLCFSHRQDNNLQRIQKFQQLW